MDIINREELRERMASEPDPPVVEVLGEDQFDEFHLPGAVNVPVDAEDFEDRIVDIVPDKDQPVVVYCRDTECDASPRAAEHMEELGYTEVLDYEEGKVGWKEAGLPLED